MAGQDTDVSSHGSIALVGNIVSVTGGADAKVVVIRDGRIESVGDASLARRAAESGIPVRDVGNRAIIPGFVDPHTHLELFAAARGRGVDCRVPGCRTIPEVLDRLADGRQNIAAGDWLHGFGNLFFDQKLAERRLPTRAELDSVSTDIPIQLQCGGHTSVLNSRALEYTQVERFLHGAAGGWGRPVVKLDKHGDPNGIVSEIDQFIPAPPIEAGELGRHIGREFRQRFTAYGVTTFGEMLSSIEKAEIFDERIANKEIPARGAVYPIVSSLDQLEEVCDWILRFESRKTHDWLRAAGVKLFADGGYSSRNAATRTRYVREHAPYGDYMGQLNLGQGEVLQALQVTRRYGVQLAIHANGARAQDEILDALQAAGEPHSFPPIRIEHAGNLVNERKDLKRFRQGNIIPVLQPGFLYNFMADFVPLILGDAGSHGRLPLRSMLDDMVRPAASSDAGAAAEDEETNPLFSIWECMARRSYWGLHIEQEQAISFDEALGLHTIAGARALGMENSVGSLDPGKVGDVVVLDRDPRTGGLEQVRNTEVDSVYVSGVEMHRRESSR